MSFSDSDSEDNPSMVNSRISTMSIVPPSYYTNASTPISPTRRVAHMLPSMIEEIDEIERRDSRGPLNLSDNDEEQVVITSNQDGAVPKSILDTSHDSSISQDHAYKTKRSVSFQAPQPLVQSLNRLSATSTGASGSGEKVLKDHPEPRISQDITVKGQKPCLFKNEFKVYQDAKLENIEKFRMAINLALDDLSKDFIEKSTIKFENYYDTYEPNTKTTKLSGDKKMVKKYQDNINKMKTHYNHAIKDINHQVNKCVMNINETRGRKVLNW